MGFELKVDTKNVIMDYWNRESLCKGLKIKQGYKLTVAQTKDENRLEDWHTAFGHHVITKGEKYKWKFKITSNTPDAIYKKAAIFIGICSYPVHEGLMKQLNNTFFVEDEDQWGSYDHMHFIHILVLSIKQVNVITLNLNAMIRILLR